MTFLTWKAWWARTKAIVEFTYLGSVEVLAFGQTLASAVTVCLRRSSRWSSLTGRRTSSALARKSPDGGMVSLNVPNAG